jgi:hypothetical protein
MSTHMQIEWTGDRPEAVAVGPVDAMKESRDRKGCTGDEDAIYASLARGRG